MALRRCGDCPASYQACRPGLCPVVARALENGASIEKAGRRHDPPERLVADQGHLARGGVRGPDQPPWWATRSRITRPTEANTVQQPLALKPHRHQPAPACRAQLLKLCGHWRVEPQGCQEPPRITRSVGGQGSAGGKQPMPVLCSNRNPPQADQRRRRSKSDRQGGDAADVQPMPPAGLKIP